MSRENAGGKKYDRFFQKLFQPIVRGEPTPQEKDELSKIYYYIIVNSCLKKVH